MYLADLRVVRYTEKYLYDFPAIISAVGGSMGLFLGFSFYAMGKNLIDRLLWQLTCISLVLGLSNSGLLITSHAHRDQDFKTLKHISSLLLRTRRDPFIISSFYGFTPHFEFVCIFQFRFMNTYTLTKKNQRFSLNLSIIRRVRFQARSGRNFVILRQVACRSRDGVIKSCWNSKPSALFHAAISCDSFTRVA